MHATHYSINKIASIVNGKLFNGKPNTENISTLLTDSRKINSPSTSLFFALKGDRHDGHFFIPDLMNAGIVNFVVSDATVVQKFTTVNFILVDNTLDALQKLAAHHRQQFSFPVIGITGSNGKTIIKEWLYQLLREDYHIVRSPKSYNSQTGVPLSVWNGNNEHNLGIFEAGISMPGEMEKLEHILKPDIGIFSNIGSSHDEHFQSRTEKIKEKLKLFSHASLLIFCKDYTGIAEQIQTAEIIPPTCKTFTWSRRIKADLQIGKVTKENNETQMQGTYQNRFISIKIPFTDEASVENAINCWALMLHLKIDDEVIAERMELLSPVAMRLEMKEGINHCSIINDSYNSDLGSLNIALDFLNQQKNFNKRTLVLSDILQSGKNEESLYKEVALLIRQKNITRLIGIGNAISRQADLFDVEKTFYTSTEEFLKQFHHIHFNHEVVLLKGARPFGFERISRALQQKAHETVMEINLNSIIHNLNYYRARLKPETKIMAMVKAFAYGSGSFELANILQFNRVHYLTVAYADEGVALRKAGITLPIMVMNPEEQSFEQMIQYYLEPELYSFRILSRFSEVVRRNVASLANGVFPVHIKLDTGMHRLGFEEEDLNELIVRLKNNRHLKVESVFTHLAASDEAEHDKFTKDQFNRFDKMSDELVKHFNYPVLKHALNSSGIIRFPEAQYDMVRIGIGLHGIAPTAAEQRQLQTVATLKTTISQIKTVKAGETIGYSRRGKATTDVHVATIGIGYADGINRKMGNGNSKMSVNGKFALTIGSICMDMCMLDVTDISCKEGDEVIIFGSDNPVTKVAEQLGTIPYEILTGISQRVKRVYYYE